MDRLPPELIALLVIAIVLVAFLAVRPSVTRQPGGRVLTFVGLLLIPTLTLWRGFDQHMEQTKTRAFCLSCHVMARRAGTKAAIEPSASILMLAGAALVSNGLSAKGSC